MKLTKAHLDFLALLDDVPKPRRDLPLATREIDRVRQLCKREGLAEFVGGYMNGVRCPMGWRITDAGRAVLSTPESSR